MSIFSLRNRLVDDYRAYVESLVEGEPPPGVAHVLTHDESKLREIGEVPPTAVAVGAGRNRSRIIADR
jgi:hypothetical protein